jgi:hypothetical protein
MGVRAPYCVLVAFHKQDKYISVGRTNCDVAKVFLARCVIPRYLRSENLRGKKWESQKRKELHSVLRNRMTVLLIPGRLTSDHAKYRIALEGSKTPQKVF